MQAFTHHCADLLSSLATFIFLRCVYCRVAWSHVRSALVAEHCIAMQETTLSSQQMKCLICHILVWNPITFCNVGWHVVISWMACIRACIRWKGGGGRWSPTQAIACPSGIHFSLIDTGVMKLKGAAHRQKGH